MNRLEEKCKICIDRYYCLTYEKKCNFGYTAKIGNDKKLQDIIDERIELGRVST